MSTLSDALAARQAAANNIDGYVAALVAAIEAHNVAGDTASAAFWQTYGSNVYAGFDAGIDEKLRGSVAPLLAALNLAVQANPKAATNVEVLGINADTESDVGTACAADVAYVNALAAAWTPA